MSCWQRAKGLKSFRNKLQTMEDVLVEQMLTGAKYATLCKVVKNTKIVCNSKTCGKCENCAKMQTLSKMCDICPPPFESFSKIHPNFGLGSKKRRGKVWYLPPRGMVFFPEDIKFWRVFWACWSRFRPFWPFFWDPFPNCRYCRKCKDWFWPI